MTSQFDRHRLLKDLIPYLDEYEVPDEVGDQALRLSVMAKLFSNIVSSATENTSPDLLKYAHKEFDRVIEEYNDLLEAEIARQLTNSAEDLLK